MKQINNFYFNDNIQIETIDEEIKPFLIQNDFAFYTQAINTSLIESIALFKTLDYKSSNVLIKNILIIINNNIELFLNDVEKEVKKIDQEIEQVTPNSNKEDKNKDIIQYLCDEFLSYKFYIEEGKDLNIEINVDLKEYGVKTLEDLDEKLNDVIFKKVIELGVSMDVFKMEENGNINLTPNYKESAKEYLQ